MKTIFYVVFFSLVVVGTSFPPEAIDTTDPREPHEPKDFKDLLQQTTTFIKDLLTEFKKKMVQENPRLERVGEIIVANLTERFEELIFANLTNAAVPVSNTTNNNYR